MLYYIRKLRTYVSLLLLFKGALSDNDIKRLLGYHIFIYPFSKENLKPSSYNLTASKCAFVKVKEEKEEKQKLIVKDDKIIIPAGKTGIVETQESIYVSKWITGTYHSRVKLANMGLGHIGTTLDPCFFGVSAIALHNTTDHDITIKVGDSIATLMFYSLKSQSNGLHDNLSGRVDDNINLGVENFYNFTDDKRNMITVIKEEIDKNIEIDDTFIKDKVKVIKDKEKVDGKSVVIYDIGKPVCTNCLNCNSKEECAFKLLKNIYSDEEKRNKVVEEIKEWKSQQWIINKESLIKIVKEKVRMDNNNRDILEYSLLSLFVGLMVIALLIMLIDSDKYHNLNEVFKTMIGVIIPTVTIIIGMIVKHKKI